MITKLSLKMKKEKQRSMIKVILIAESVKIVRSS